MLCELLTLCPAAPCCALAQVRRLARERGMALSQAHLLANALAKLARGVERLNAEVSRGVCVMRSCTI